MSFEIECPECKRLLTLEDRSIRDFPECGGTFDETTVLTIKPNRPLLLVVHAAYSLLISFVFALLLLLVIFGGNEDTEYTLSGLLVPKSIFVLSVSSLGALTVLSSIGIIKKTIWSRWMTLLFYLVPFAGSLAIAIYSGLPSFPLAGILIAFHLLPIAIAYLYLYRKKSTKSFYHELKETNANRTSLTTPDAARPTS